MHIVVLGIFILKLQTSVSQYPNHMDFQQVGSIIFNNENYNILKPTAHVIADYFKEFMLKKINSEFPTKRVFIDKNGFRHSWSGYDNKIKSLRKTKEIDTNLIDNSIKDDKFTEDETESNVASGNEDGNDTVETTTTTDQNVSTIDTSENSTLSDVSENKEDDVSENKEDDVSENKEDDVSENKEDNVSENKERSNSVEKIAEDIQVVIEQRLRGGNKTKTTKTTAPAKSADKSKTTTPAKSADKSKTTTPAKSADKSKTTAPAKKSKSTKKAPAKNNNKTAKVAPEKTDDKKPERTVAKTTFYCPFFGVITMSAFID